MTSLRIAEVSERTGVPATTLRYYDEIGLLPAASRAANGYRAYAERDVERLRFLTRAKRLDLSLDDLRVLLEAWDGDCAGTRERMSTLVRRRLAETQDRVTDLVALAAQLQVAVARLDAPASLDAAARVGGCDAGCACEVALAQPVDLAEPVEPAADRAVAADRQRAPTLLPLAPAEAGDAPDLVPIACRLEAGALPGRLDDWRVVLARATGRTAVPGGVELTFAGGPDAVALAAELGRLAAAEADCCRFFEFAVLVSADRVRLRVTGPPGAADVITAVFGSP